MLVCCFIEIHSSCFFLWGEDDQCLSFSPSLFFFFFVSLFFVFSSGGVSLFGNKKSRKEVLLTKEGEKKIVLQNILLEVKGRSLPVSSYTHLPRHQEIALVFSMVHSFCTQTHHKNSISPFHSISRWRISILMMSFFHPRKEDQKPKITQTLEKQILHVNSTALA